MKFVPYMILGVVILYLVTFIALLCKDISTYNRDVNSRKETITTDYNDNMIVVIEMKDGTTKELPATNNIKIIIER